MLHRDSRVTELHEVVPDLFEEHDDSHLQAQIDQTATWVTLRATKGKKKKKLRHTGVISALRFEMTTVCTRNSLHSREISERWMT